MQLFWILIRVDNTAYKKNISLGVRIGKSYTSTCESLMTFLNNVFIMDVYCLLTHLQPGGL